MSMVGGSVIARRPWPWRRRQIRGTHLVIPKSTSPVPAKVLVLLGILGGDSLLLLFALLTPLLLIPLLLLRALLGALLGALLHLLLNSGSNLADCNLGRILSHLSCYLGLPS